MKTIEAVIEIASDGFYSIFCKNVMFSGCGNTPDEAKSELFNQMKFYKKTAIEMKYSYPAFLDDEFEVIYTYDTESLLNYYLSMFTPDALQRLTGISQKQLLNYLYGRSKPRRPQIKKIEKGLQLLGKELTAISF